ncbi:LOW QUALITY PROTEIN: probable glycosyltransferase At5g03795 [Durio zibethinus]|uniref:LOW QUALITY PROTEIN: probable glycosyltransferase At5g03795 n=1 Tax=Durio zibethinus TaxID=66656 RepID=A0A6P5XQP5_DURZI|nr:LOW QUALITY PROTEIN: probable glycosyltransferase At5g03795 [Durio zibethinus]
MGHELKSLFQLDTRKLIWLIGITFVVIITFQYVELPYENVLSTLFPSAEVSVEGESSFLASGPSSAQSEVVHNVTHSIGLEYNGTYAAGNETALDNDISEGKDTDLNNDVISETDVDLNKSSTFDEGSESPKESSTEELVELNKNSTVDYVESSKNKTTAEEGGRLSWESEKEGNMTSLNSMNQTGVVNETVNDFRRNDKDQNTDFISEGEVGLNKSAMLDHDSTSSRDSSTEEFEDLNKNSTVDLLKFPIITVAEEASKTEESFSSKNDTVDINTSNNNIGNKNITLAPASTVHSNPGIGSPLPALPLKNSSANTTLEKDVETNIRTPVVSFNSSISSVEQHVTPSFDKNAKSEEIQNNFPASGDNSSLPSTPRMKKKPEMPPALTTIADMNNLFYQSRVSYYSKTPRWSSGADKVLLNARSQIQNAPIVKNDQQLYAPLYRNVSMFKRSYELMESTLKVYIYKEGKRPIVHTPPLKGIYASEGWFMKQLEANKRFVTKSPREAHLFYLPFSSRMLEETLYVPDSHSHKNLIEYLKNYVDMIAAKYPFWNRTEGADHFLVACHDWAPSETKEYMANCIRALCNSDVREGYIFGKDVSLPETYVRNPRKPLRDLGGKPPSKRSILAFFAGGMHGYLRPILLEQWGNKDPDMKIFGNIPNVKGKMNYIQYMKSSKYCLCPRGYEVNSPRVVEAIFYECVPVIISDNFVPPFFEVLNWESFAVFILEKDIPNLKKILLSIPAQRYRRLQLMVKKIQQHFLWHPRPEKYDIFHMILHSVWYNRVFQIKPR